MGILESWEKMGKSRVIVVLRYQDKQGEKLSLTDKQLF